MKITKILSLYFFVTLMFVAGACSGGKRATVYNESRTAMGSVATLMAYGDNPDQIKKGFQAAFLEIERLENEFSMYRPNSKMVEVNTHASTNPVKISKEFQNVIKTSLQIGQLSEGAFDISFAAMSHLWKFSGSDEEQKVPIQEEIDKYHQFVDYRKIILDEAAETISLNPGMAIGLGGLVKGYAADRAIEVMRGHGLDNCMAYLGGDIRVLGEKGGKPWTVGVQDPRGSGYFATIMMGDEAVVSSGDYERYFEKNGHRYHHIIDPRTGYPAEGLRHVTIVGPETMMADALATAVMVLGTEKGMALLEKLAGYEGLLIDQRNNLHITNGLKDRVKVQREPTP